MASRRAVAIVALLWTSSIGAQSVPSVPRDRALPRDVLARTVVRLDLPRPVSADADWQRVVHLPAGQPVVVEADGAPPVRRYFVSADTSAIILLNLSDPAIPEEVRRACIQLSTNAPERILGAMQGEAGGFGRLALQDGGVFLNDRRVADLTAIVQTIPQAHVIAITRAESGRHSARIVGGLVMAGGLGLNLATQGRTYGGEPDITKGMVIGAGLIFTGAVVLLVGEHSSGHTLERIYRRQ